MSQVHLLSKQKYFKKPEQYVLNDKCMKENPKDPFKTTFVMVKKKNQVTGKSMHSLQSKHSRFKSSKSQKRFTDYEMQAKYKGSFVENAKPIVSLADRAPFYSSFTEDHVFDIPARTIRNTNLSFKTATNTHTRTNTNNNTLQTT